MHPIMQMGSGWINGKPCGRGGGRVAHAASLWIRHVAWALLLASCASTPEGTPRADWADVTLEARGEGRAASSLTWSPDARLATIRNAKADAYARLEYQVMTLEIAPGQTVLRRIEGDPSLQRKVSAFVRGAQMTGMENTPQGIQMRVRLYLGENFKAILGLTQKKATTSAHPPTHLSQ